MASKPERWVTDIEMSSLVGDRSLLPIATSADAAVVTDQRSQEIVDGLGDAAGGDADRRASQEIVSALRTHKDSVSGAAAVPLQDPQLSSKIMADARSRSQEIRDAARAKPAERPIPAWLWLAWIAAIAAVAVAWWFLR